MISAVRWIVLLLLCAAGAPAAEKDSVLTLFVGRKVALAVPDGFTLDRAGNATGTGAVKISGPKGSIELSIVFLPDPSDGEFALSARARKEYMVGEFQRLVGSSTEQAMQFEELGSASGVGTYCAFTDSSLVGKSELPPNEFRHLTVGLKAWPGVIAVFQLFSNETSSPEYRSLLAVLRDSVRLLPVSPLK